jgi:hypothetical protein
VLKAREDRIVLVIEALKYLGDGWESKKSDRRFDGLENKN